MPSSSVRTVVRLPIPDRRDFSQRSSGVSRGSEGSGVSSRSASERASGVGVGGISIARLVRGRLRVGSGLAQGWGHGVKQKEKENEHRIACRRRSTVKLFQDLSRAEGGS